MTDWGAMIFAAGRGTRMQPLTNHVPKPLVTVNGRTLLDYALSYLQAAGIKSAVVNTHYLAQQVRDYLALYQAAKPQIHITELFEPVLLETGGGLVHALPHFAGKEEILSMNSDTICTYRSQFHGITALQSGWDSNKMDLQLLLHPKEKAIGYQGAGDFDLAPDGQLIRKGAGKPHDYVFTGVQVMAARALTDYVKTAAEKTIFSLNALYWSRLQQDGRLQRMYGVVNQAEMLHVSSPDDIKLAEIALKQQPDKVRL